MKSTMMRLGAACAAALAVSATSHAAFDWNQLRMSADEMRYRQFASNFQRIATLGNYRNLGEAGIDAETVSEIVAVTQDGRTLVYTDSPGEAIGLVDITKPFDPQPAGRIALEGEPTSVDILGNDLALVALNTSDDFVNASGDLVVIDLRSRAVVAEIALGGQPDSIKISPDEAYVAIAIENERDEDVTVDGVEGGLPQLPAGYLAILDIKGPRPSNWSLRTVDMTGLASYGATDPEPEFVDINADNEAVVSFQENNHLVVVDLPSGNILSHFSAGEQSLTGVDATEDGVIAMTEDLADIPREPDAVTWLGMPGVRQPLIGTANEGDLFGGSRGFSIFDTDGELLFDSGSAFEEVAVQHGHYPEDRSENKGSEPEAIEYGRFGREHYLFVASERGSFIAVYKLLSNGLQFVQLLPAPLGPEGLLAIPERNLLIASGEEDDPAYGVRSSIMVYELKRDKGVLKRDGRAYPDIVSDDVGGRPIGWSALSGLVATSGNNLLGVWDSYYSESRIFQIDASAKPAIIRSALNIQGGNGNYDPEGIAVAPDGTYWIASEGNATDARPNRLLQVHPTTGQVLAEIGLPQEILDCRAASEKRGTLGSGFEGVAVLPERKGYKLLVAQQRGWDYTTEGCEDLDDDAGGLNARGEPNHSRIWSYEPATGLWDHIAWELAPLPELASWVGLSEITRAPDGSYVLIERDNRTGDFAELKTLVQVSPQSIRAGLVTASDKRTHDLLPQMRATRGWVTDKPEGVAITSRGRTFVVTDNDGVEDWSGETQFLEYWSYRSLFR